MRHAQGEAFLKAAVLALVSVLLLNFTAPLTPLVLQFHTDCSTKEALLESGQREKRNREMGHCDNTAAPYKMSQDYCQLESQDRISFSATSKETSEQWNTLHASIHMEKD